MYRPVCLLNQVFFDLFTPGVRESYFFAVYNFKLHTNQPQVVQVLHSPAFFRRASDWIEQLVVDVFQHLDLNVC